jgi:glycine cleavage system H protein
VTEVNTALTQAPETLNRDPHGAGWICKMSVGSPSELEGLMDAAAYAAMVGV